MLYNSTKTLLRSISEALEAADDASWDDHIESGKECLYEMHQMTRPAYRAYKTDTPATKWPARIPDSERLSRAMPHVKCMVGALRRKDRVAALESSRAALAEM